MVKLLIFDLDGTLIDSAPDIVDSANELLVETGRARLSDATVKAAIGHGVNDLVEKLIPEVKNDLSLRSELVERFVAIYSTNIAKKTKCYPGVIEFLSSNTRKIAIVTNKRSDLTRLVLTALELDRFPWVTIVAGDSLPKKKPDPLPLNEAMRLANVRTDETIMIGDGLPDIAAAKAAQVRSIAIAFGYTEEARLKEAGANRSIREFRDLSRAISSLEEG